MLALCAKLDDMSMSCHVHIVGLSVYLSLNFLNSFSRRYHSLRYTTIFDMIMGKSFTGTGTKGGRAS